MITPLYFLVILTPLLAGGAPAHVMLSEPPCSTFRSELGQEEQAAFALRRALSAGRVTCIMLSGRFLLATPLRITAAHSGLLIRSFPDESAELVATRGTARGIEVIRASNVRIEGISLSGFARDGIFASNSRNLTIRSVRVKETGSTAWSQGSIHLTGTSTGALVEANRVEGADYAGIIVDTDTASDISDVVIRNNHVSRSCQRVHDCGAIYVNDRGRRSRNILIADNVIADFGSFENGGRGIYLDDWASFVTVINNRITGSGQYAFQIHGGQSNRIAGNRIDMSHIPKFLLYQAASNGTRAEMKRNTLSGNTLVVPADRQAAIVAAACRRGSGNAKLAGNRLCTGGTCKPLC